MTILYFVRHAEPNYMNHDDMSRELTEKGLNDSKLVTRFLSNKGIDIVFSSPYKRAIDTIRDFSESEGLEIHLEDDFRERKVDSGWIEDFTSFYKAQWKDFDFKLSDGETFFSPSAIMRMGKFLYTPLDEYSPQPWLQCSRDTKGDWEYGEKCTSPGPVSTVYSSMLQNVLYLFINVKNDVEFWLSLCYIVFVIQYLPGLGHQGVKRRRFSDFFTSLLFLGPAGKSKRRGQYGETV